MDERDADNVTEQFPPDIAHGESSGAELMRLGGLAWKRRPLQLGVCAAAALFLPAATQYALPDLTPLSAGVVPSLRALGSLAAFVLQLLVALAIAAYGRLVVLGALRNEAGAEVSPITARGVLAAARGVLVARLWVGVMALVFVAPVVLVFGLIVLSATAVEGEPIFRAGAPVLAVAVALLVGLRYAFLTDAMVLHGLPRSRAAAIAVPLTGHNPWRLLTVAAVRFAPTLVLLILAVPYTDIPYVWTRILEVAAPVYQTALLPLWCVYYLNTYHAGDVDEEASRGTVFDT